MGAEQTVLPNRLIDKLHGKELERELTTVWARFIQMISLPYPKTANFPHGDASQMIRYFEEYALYNQFRFETDGCQNVCMSVVASLGRENDREIVVQGHHDAVFVGNPDPSIYGVKPVLTGDGEWIRGDGTNLTADNRLGVALGLTAVESLVRSGKSHGPIKILLTYGEDSGLIGATYLGETKSPFLNRNQTLINVDSSEGSEWITIGCASGSRDNLTIPVDYEAIGDKKLVKYAFSGFPGGHSAINIGEDLPSSIKFFAELFADLKQKFPNIGLVSIRAGEAFNAIPASASFILAINGQNEHEAQKCINRYIEEMKSQIQPDAPEEYKKARINIAAHSQLLSSEEQQIRRQLDQATTDLLINVLSELPQGVGKKDGDAILSSNNVGVVETQDGEIIIQAMTRGKETLYREDFRNLIRQVAQKYSVSMKEVLAYPHWLPQPGRRIVKLARELGEQLLGREVKTRTSLGGLEPGIFERDFPGLEAISISAARIENEHSLREQANINSLGEGFVLLSELLTELPRAYYSL